MTSLNPQENLVPSGDSQINRPPDAESTESHSEIVIPPEVETKLTLESGEGNRDPNPATFEGSNHLSKDPCFCGQNAEIILISKEENVPLCLKHVEYLGLWITRSKWNEKQQVVGFEVGNCTNYRDGDFDEWIPPIDEWIPPIEKLEVKPPKSSLLGGT